MYILLVQGARLDLIREYLAKLSPRLHAIVQRVLARMLGARQGGVQRGNGGAGLAFTFGPVDIGVVMLEHLRLPQQGGSRTLQRRVACMAVSEVRFLVTVACLTASYLYGYFCFQLVWYSREVLADAMAAVNPPLPPAARQAPSPSLSTLYAAALISDTGVWG